METLLLKDVRCFRGDHTARLAPLTLLVGENSTGKSTFLALTRIAWDIAFGAVGPDFNEDPFYLGSYEELAHYHGGRGARTRSFSIGGSFANRSRRRLGSGSTTVIGTFAESAGQPAVCELKFESGKWRILAKAKGDDFEIEFTTPKKTYELVTTPELHLPTLSARTLTYILDFLRYSPAEAGKVLPLKGRPPTREEIHQLSSLLQPLRSLRSGGQGASQRPIAFAPVRTRPKRTYDPLKESRSPEGDHVPMLLARLSTASPAEWTELAQELADYGQSSGLFNAVKVKRYGKSESAPFQLRVKLAGQKKEVNLIDVGYGVSQVLPIVVDSLTYTKATRFLMQQPEVHLHPRAQAELGSFIAGLTQSRRHSFVIETHSDHIVDRIRMAIKGGTVPPDWVKILFFDRSGTQVRIEEINIDSAGNLVDAPEGYRRFFLDEELRLIT